MSKPNEQWPQTLERIKEVYKMNKLNEYKAMFRTIPAERWAHALQETKKQIDFLESIYQTGGEHNHYSQPFKDAAVRERDELCQQSSALYYLLREEQEMKEEQQK